MGTKRTNAGANSAKRTDTLVSGTYTLPETARRLGIGTTTVYDAIRRGDPPFGTEAQPGPIPVLRIGGHKFTLVAQVERYLTGLERDTA